MKEIIHLQQLPCDICSTPLGFHWLPAAKKPPEFNIKPVCLQCSFNLTSVVEFFGFASTQLIKQRALYFSSRILVEKDSKNTIARNTVGGNIRYFESLLVT